MGKINNMALSDTPSWSHKLMYISVRKNLISIICYSTYMCIIMNWVYRAELRSPRRNTSHWLCLVKSEGAFAGCCHWSLWSSQEPTVNTWNLVVEWTDGRSYTKKAIRLRPRGLKLPTTKHAVWLGKSEAQKEEFAPVCPDCVGVFSIAKRMDHTN